MSTGDASAQNQFITNDESDDSSSSKSLFNRPPIPIVSSVTKVMNDEHILKSNSHIRCLEDKVNNLQQVILELSNQVHQLKSTGNSPMCSPNSNFRSNSTHNYTNNDYIDEHRIINPSRSPLCTSKPNHIFLSQPTQMKPFDYFDPSNDVEHIRNFQDVLTKTTAALERRDIENHLLKKEIDQLRGSRPLPGQHSSNASTPSSHVTQPLSQHSHTSAFVPIVPAFQPTRVTIPTNTSTTPSIMPFTMSLTNSLPSFGGKANELPTKFITEFELRASGLFGYHDEYLIRAIQQVLSDTALTWFVQQQQQLPITTWSQFKQLFLQRFRTTDKIESLRSRLRILWQGDTEPTVDYFEKLKALISEIEPVNSIDYLKRKFLQKLRKDIREKMPIGLTSSLSELLQKAIEIETNIIQQQIDDKLRAAQKEEQKNKNQSTTVNNLYNISATNPPHLSSATLQDSSNNYGHNYNYNQNRHSFGNQYSRTYTNSTPSLYRPPKVQNTSNFDRSIVNPSGKVKSKNNNRWCSFCSSKSHTWFHCYSNPNGPKYQPARSQNAPTSAYPCTLPSNYYEHQHSNQPQSDQQLNQNNYFPQQQSQQHNQQPYSSSYASTQRPSMSENIRGSRY